MLDLYHVPNDRELLDCLAKGWTVEEIAEEYGRGTSVIYRSFMLLRERMGAKTKEHAIHIFDTRPQFDARGYWPVASASDAHAAPASPARHSA